MSHLTTLIVNATGLLLALIFFVACVLTIIKGFQLPPKRGLPLIAIGSFLILTEIAFIQTAKEYDKKLDQESKQEAFDILHKEIEQKQKTNAKLWV